MSDEEEIQKYIQIFRNLSNQKSEIVNEAANEIARPDISLIPTLASVFLKCDEINVKRLAIISIQRALISNSNDEYMKKCDEYMKNPAYSNCIEEISIAALQSEDSLIRDFTSQLLSLVIGIQKEAAQGMIIFFVDKLKSEEIDESISANFIDIFTGVLSLPNFSDHFRKECFYPFFYEIFEICKSVISRGDQLQNVLTISACNYIGSVIDFLPIIIDSEEIIGDLLKSFESSLSIGNKDITELLYRIMFMVFKLFYEHSMSFMETIFEHTRNNIQKFAKCPPLQQISIHFWNEIAQYEYHLSKSMFISEQAFPQLGIFLLGILNPKSQIVSFDISNVFNEDSFISPLYEEATETIISFSKTVPNCVFDIISQQIKVLLETPSDDVEVVVYALGLFYSISNSNIDKNVFISFLDNYWDDFIMLFIGPQIPPLLRALAFFLIRSVFDNFPSFITDGNQIDDRLLNIINSMDMVVRDESDQPVSDIDPIFCIFYARVIDSICKLWKNENLINSRLYYNQVFAPIQQRIDEIFHFGIQINSFPIIRESSIAISHLIEFSYYKDKTDDFCEWYKEKIKELAESSEIPDPDLRYYVKSQLCSIVGSFMLKINYEELNSVKDNHSDESESGFGVMPKEEICLKLSQEALAILFDCLKMENFVFDDASYAFKNLITKTPDIIVPYAESILKCCFNALQSEEPSSINNSCLLISALFDKYFDILRDQLSQLFEQLFDIIVNMPEITSVHKNIFSTIGSILASPSKGSYKNFNEYFLTGYQQIEGFIIEKLRSAQNHEIYYKNIEDENDYFRGILHLYRGYCLAFMYCANIPAIDDLVKSELNLYDADFFKREKEQILILHSIAHIILKNINFISDEVIYDFLDDYRIVILRCSKINNMLLNRMYFNRMLKNEFDDEKIKNAVEEIKKLKKGR